jgi:hypothetical protein
MNSTVINAEANAHEIIPRLWLGNAKASMDEQFIREKGIQVVFNCTKNLAFSPMIPIKYRIPVDDNLEEEEMQALIAKAKGRKSESTIGASAGF